MAGQCELSHQPAQNNIDRFFGDIKDSKFVLNMDWLYPKAVNDFQEISLNRALFCSQQWRDPPRQVIRAAGMQVSQISTSNARNSVSITSNSTGRQPMACHWAS